MKGPAAVPSRNRQSSRAGKVGATAQPAAPSTHRLHDKALRGQEGAGRGVGVEVLVEGRGGEAEEVQTSTMPAACSPLHRAGCARAAQAA